MLQFLIDIGLIVGTFLDPSPTEPKPRYPREGWSEINRENNNAKELFGITIPEKPSEQLIKFVDFTNAAYLSYVFGVRVAFSTATKDDAEYYFGAVTDLSLNFLINDSATPSSCSMKYINSVLDLKVYGSRAIVKTFEYLHVKEDDLPQEVIDYGTHAIDFLRETFHQNCSEPENLTMEDERTQVLLTIIASCNNHSDESPQTSEGLKHVHQYNPSVRKDALKAFDKAHEENITANISVTNPQDLLFDTISSGVLFHYYTLLYVIGENESEANKSTALLHYSKYAKSFLKLGKLVSKKTNFPTLINTYAKLTTSSYQFTLNLLQFTIKKKR